MGDEEKAVGVGVDDGAHHRSSARHQRLSRVVSLPVLTNSREAEDATSGDCGVLGGGSGDGSSIQWRKVGLRRSNDDCSFKRPGEYACENDDEEEDDEDEERETGADDLEEKKVEETVEAAGEDQDLPFPGFTRMAFFYFDQTMAPRSWCLRLITWPWFERISMAVIILNCITLGMYQPCTDEICKTLQCHVLECFDHFIFAFFAAEMLIKVMAMGLVGRNAYLMETWNGFDLFIVLSGVVEYSVAMDNFNLSAFRAIRVLRPLRAINRIPSMRILVMLLLDTLPMLGNILLLCFFVFFIFGIIGVQLWSGLLRQRCFLELPANVSNERLTPYFIDKYDRDFICSKPTDDGMTGCSDIPNYTHLGRECYGSAELFLNDTSDTSDNQTCINWNQYYTSCRNESGNPFLGTISFDNIGLAWIAIFQVISLAGWVNIMYYVQDVHSFWDWIYFVALIVIGAFFMINLCLVVIATQFSETKKRETERMLQERQRFHSSSTLMSNQELGGCYDEIIRYVAHLGRRAKRKVRFLYRSIAHANGWLKPEPTVTVSLRHRKGHHKKAKDANSAHNHHSEATSAADQSGQTATDLNAVEANLGCQPRAAEQRDGNRDSVFCESNENSCLISGGANGYPNQLLSGRINHAVLPTTTTTVTTSTTTTTGTTTVGAIKDLAHDRQDATKQGFGISLACCQHNSEIFRCHCCVSDTVSVSCEENYIPGCHQPQNHVSDAENDGKVLRVVDENDVDDKERDGNDDNDETGSGCSSDNEDSGKSRRNVWQWFTVHVKRCVDGKIFQRGILVAILVNTLSMGIEYHNQPEWLTDVLEYSNLIFSVLFAVEMLAKVVAEGMFGYLKSGFNLFDGFIVALSFVELFQGGTGGLSVLRTFRLLRILKLVRFMPALRYQLVIMLKTMDNVATFFSLLVLFIFIFSVLGMHLFGGKFCTRLSDKKQCTCAEILSNQCKCDRKNFDTLQWSLVTVFQILTQEDWHEVLYSGMAKTSHWSALYFIALMTFGNYVLFNLLVAILVEGFSADGELEGEALDAFEEQQLEKRKKIIKLNAMEHRTKKGAEKDKDTEDPSTRLSLSDVEEGEQEIGIPPDTPMSITDDAASSVLVSVSEIKEKCQTNGAHMSSLSTLSQITGDALSIGTSVTLGAAEGFESNKNLLSDSAVHCNEHNGASELPKEVGLYRTSRLCDSGDHYRYRLNQMSRQNSVKMYHQYSGSPKSYFGGACEPTRRRYVNGPFSPKLNIYGQVTISSLIPHNSFQSYFKAKGAHDPIVTSSNLQSSANLHQEGNTSPNDSLGEHRLISTLSPINSLTPQGSFRRHRGTARDNSIRMRPRVLSVHHSFNCPRTFSPRESFRHRRRLSSNGQSLKGAPPYLGRRNTISSGGGGHCPVPLSLRDIYQLSRQGSLRSHHSLFQQPSLVSLTRSNRQTSIAENTEENDTVVEKSSPSDEGTESVAERITANICQRRCFGLSWLLKLESCVRSRSEYAFFLLSPTNRLREICRKLTSWPRFDNTLLMFIVLNCITLAMERPDIPSDSVERQFLTLSNYAFTVIFAIEMVIKVISRGFIYGSNAYLRSGWNVIDGTLVFISLIDVCVSLTAAHSPRIFGILRVFRLLRTLRPLRVISRAPGLKLVVQTLLSSLRPIGNIVLICCMFFVIFGILGVQLFKGTFYYCEGPNTTDIVNKTDCELKGEPYRWINRKYNFDNLGMALMALFVLASKDGWVNIMYTGLDAVGVDQQPKINNNEWCLLYFISFLLLVGFFVLNMFVGVVVENFHKCRENQEMEEKARRQAIQMKKLERKRKKLKELPYWSHYSKARLFIHTITSSKYFDLAIACVIGVNVVTMATEYHTMPPEFEFALKIFNFFFTSVFVLEALVKIMAQGILRYFKDKWNQLDMAIVILSIVGIVLEEMESKQLPINPTIIRVMRVLRIARVLKLLKMAKSVRMLLDTVVQALPEVGNLGLLFFLLFFIFAALGVELFGRVECSQLNPCEGLGKHAHFRNFGMAFLTLFRVATGDNWNGIMKDTLRTACDTSDDCVKNCCVSPVIAPVFFVIFVLMAQFVLVNVVVAVLMKHLEESNKYIDDEGDIEDDIKEDVHEKEEDEAKTLERSSLDIVSESGNNDGAKESWVKNERIKSPATSKAAITKYPSLPKDFVFFTTSRLALTNNGESTKKNFRGRSMNQQHCLPVSVNQACKLSSQQIKSCVECENTRHSSSIVELFDDPLTAFPVQSHHEMVLMSPLVTTSPSAIHDAYGRTKTPLLAEETKLSLFETLIETDSYEMEIIALIPDTDSLLDEMELPKVRVADVTEIAIYERPATEEPAEVLNPSGSKVKHMAGETGEKHADRTRSPLASLRRSTEDLSSQQQQHSQHLCNFRSLRSVSISEMT